MENLSPDFDDNDHEKKETQENRQEQKAFAQKQANFQVVKAYYDSLEQGCNSKGQLTTERHQKLDKHFHQAVSQFRSHHDAHHDGDDDHDGHEDGYEDEGNHDDDDEHGEEEDHDNDHDSDHGDSFEQKERELEDKVDKMVNNHCHYQS